jgi:hypothetical protein
MDSVGVKDGVAAVPKFAALSLVVSHLPYNPSFILPSATWPRSGSRIDK